MNRAQTVDLLGLLVGYLRTNHLGHLADQIVDQVAKADKDPNHKFVLTNNFKTEVR